MGGRPNRRPPEQTGYRGVKNPVAMTVKPPPASPVQVIRFVNPPLLLNKTNVSVPSVNAREAVTNTVVELTAQAIRPRFVNVPGLTVTCVSSVHVSATGCCSGKIRWQTVPGGLRGSASAAERFGR
jgi:hypothetical protein